MSFKFSPETQARARQGVLTAKEVIAELEGTMPFAMAVYDRLAQQLREQGGVVIYAPQPLAADAPLSRQTEMAQERTELTRIAASDSVRRLMEEHFGFQMCFQNCHKVIIRQPGDETTDEEWQKETSLASQVLNQATGMQHC